MKPRPRHFKNRPGANKSASDSERRPQRDRRRDERPRRVPRRDEPEKKTSIHGVLQTLSIEKFLATQTTLSRRRILEAIQRGEIRLNERVVTSLKTIVREFDQVFYQVNLVRKDIPLLYYKFNKPKNVISSLKDPTGRTDLRAFMKDVPEQLFPVGRLDRDSKGLMIFTNDGDLSQRVAHPKFHLPKRYQVILDRQLNGSHLERCKTGMFLDDGPFTFDEVEQLDHKELLVTISEGRNRVIRRAFELLGYELILLKRLSIGPVELGSLKEGQFAPLSKQELSSLERALKNPAQIDT